MNSDMTSIIVGFGLLPHSPLGDWLSSFAFERGALLLCLWERVYGLSSFAFGRGHQFQYNIHYSGLLP